MHQDKTLVFATDVVEIKKSEYVDSHLVDFNDPRIDYYAIVLHEPNKCVLAVFKEPINGYTAERFFTVNSPLCGRFCPSVMPLVELREKFSEISKSDAIYFIVHEKLPNKPEQPTPTVKTCKPDGTQPANELSPFPRYR